jgi:hypothetical protein
MAALVLAIGVAVFISVEKLLDRKREKRTQRAQEASEHGIVEELSTDGRTTGLFKDEHLHVYHEEHISPFHKKGGHPAFIIDERHEHHNRFHQ